MADAEPKEVIRRDAIAGDVIHEYDGIEEADNQLPLWWLILFFGTIVFGVAYWFAFHEYGTGRLPLAAYAEAKTQHEHLAEREARALARKTAAQGLSSLAEDASTVAAGTAAFQVTCAACHGMKAEGNIGPNLTDDAWIHGGSAEDIQKIINEGVAAKGMPAWGPSLGAVTVQQLTAYVLSLRGSNVPGKAPQGEPYVVSEN